MKKAVIYARYSSHAQRDQSIADQIADCERYAEEEGYTILDTYADHAMTGTNDCRPAFQQMLKDSDLKQFQSVFVWKLDRFGRNREEMAVNKLHLKRNGVRLVSVKENIPDTPEGILVESLMEGLAEYYSKSLAQNVKRGMQSNANKGLVVGGRHPFGYKTVDKHFVIDEELRPVVEYIFDAYAAGYSQKEICNYLNNKGIRTQTGKIWRNSTIRRVLENSKYCGEFHGMGVKIENGIPAIVSREIYNQVQVRLEASRINRAAYRRKQVFMLSGKIFCAKCGEPYQADAGTSKTGRAYYYYVCSNKKRRKGCQNKTYRQDKLEDLVLDVALNHVLTENNIERLADRIITAMENQKESSQIPAMRAQRLELLKKQDNILAAIEEGIFTSATKDRLLEIEDSIAHIEKALIAEQNKKSIPERDAVIWFLNQFRKTDIKNEHSRQKLFDSLVHDVLIDDDIVTIRFNYTNRQSNIAEARCSYKNRMVDFTCYTMNSIIIDNWIVYKTAA